VRIDKKTGKSWKLFSPGVERKRDNVKMNEKRRKKGKWMPVKVKSTTGTGNA
jgi:hypothetical protein